MNNPRALALAALCAMLATGPAATAAVSAEEAAKLKTVLTPFGAERAANKDGSIPAWDGGYTQGSGGLQVRHGAARSVREREAALLDHGEEHRAARRQAVRGRARRC